MNSENTQPEDMDPEDTGPDATARGLLADLAVKADGLPASAAMTGFKIVTIHPPKAGTWMCLALRATPHEDRATIAAHPECRPPARIQLAMEPSAAHQLGLELIAMAEAAVKPR